MAKFSRHAVKPNVTAPIRSTGRLIPTHERGLGYERDPKSELFLLAVTNLVSEDTFYERGADRDARFAELVRRVTVEDADWVARFVPYLRDTLHLRTAALVMAAEYVAAGGPRGRAVIAGALRRADEPAELLAYWAQTRGKRFPQPVKRGVADTVTKLYDERAVLRYDGIARTWRMADVVELAHPEPKAEWQSDLFRYLLDRRHRAESAQPSERLPMLRAAAWLEATPVEGRRAWLSRPEALAQAGFSWERLSGWLQGPMDAEAWEAVLPTMGYMAVLRNLHNFDRAGIAPAARRRVLDKLADPAEVAWSRQLPLRFLSAYKAVLSLDWAPALERALDLSLGNVPSFAGRTLVLVDVSGSMFSPLSRHSTVQRWETAALFGAALAARAEKADVFAYSWADERIKVRRREAVLKTVERFRAWIGAGQGTATMDVLARRYDRHDRVVILTDEQAHPSAFDPATVPVPIYTFNLAGYRPGHLPAGTKGRYTFGGLTDAGFAAIAALESLEDTGWPF